MHIHAEQVLPRNRAAGGWRLATSTRGRSAVTSLSQRRRLPLIGAAHGRLEGAGAGRGSVSGRSRERGPASKRWQPPTAPCPAHQHRLQGQLASGALKPQSPGALVRQGAQGQKQHRNLVQARRLRSQGPGRAVRWLSAAVRQCRSLLTARRQCPAQPPHPPTPRLCAGVVACERHLRRRQLGRQHLRPRGGKVWQRIQGCADVEGSAAGCLRC